ncbi:DegT/DnrJ/EryC1/StrS family aminotransferase [Desulfobacula sp.]|uniref:DegT/DnrJ/EryC1/StrS family aminotransferase n=1 Tax=Desulfobacula sp. TaxID=2593537 RepID=UPI0026187627|nr:DegT/DnrJ/EryC1/StrS family aminotransferase [Desulfobacula sp.]
MSLLATHGGSPVFKVPPKLKWPIVDKADEELVLRSLYGDNHSYGINCECFENEFSEWNKNKYAINTNSGTAALHMCLAATGCGCGDEVLVPAYSWSSTATVVLHHNCIPVFVDIEWNSCGIDPMLLNKAVSNNTRAIIVAHLHGTPAHIEKIQQFARKYNLYLIEDACQSHGAHVHDIRVGNWGHCAAFSFNQNKTICAGDAGMFVTNEKQMYETAKRFWSFGEKRDPTQDRDNHAYALGWMYRSNDLTAAFGRGQLKKADKYIQWQRINAKMLSDYLHECSSITLPFQLPDNFCTFSAYVLRLNKDIISNDIKRLRDLFVTAIEAEGLEGHIAVWQRYILPEMTVFRAKNAYGKGCPWTCSHAAELIEQNNHKFPVSQTHCDTSFCLNTILRCPPDQFFIEQIAECFIKVDHHLDELLS